MRFETVAVLDWTGGADTGPTPRADAIWAGVVRGGEEAEPVYLRNRDLALEWIDALIAEGRRTLVCFDFPFALPAGAARRITGSDDPRALWHWISDHLNEGRRFHLAAEINALFEAEGPFWFNGLREDIDGLPRKKPAWRMPFTERREVETRAPGTFTCWQMGGAGAVGSQALTGMAALSTLARRGDVSVWPFDEAPARVVLAEIWPSLLADRVRAVLSADPAEIKDRAQVRLLSRALARLDAEGVLGELMRAVPDVARAEGWILGVGAEAALSQASLPEARPPAFADDCFALPPGVDWLPVDDALSKLRAALKPVVSTEHVPVSEADGRILAAGVTAERAHPPAANAAVDGYGFAHSALKAGTSQALPLVEGRAAAGAPFDGTLPNGSAVRILTGAILPEGVDTVVLEEDCTVEEACVMFAGPVKPASNTRKAGEDVVEGETILEPGHRLTPQDLAHLTSVGCASVTAYRPLRVGVLSTGDEITDPGASEASHQTYDANRPMLLAMLHRWSYDAVDLGIARDDASAIREALDRGAESADVILTSGGASAGDEDHVSRTLREHGRVTAWRIALKPGRPLMLGLWRDVPVFGLPGNPVASFVCTLIFARPALSLMAGGAWTQPAATTVPAAFTKRKKPGRREYLRARLTERGAAEVFPSEGSGRISGLSWSDGLVEIEDGARNISPGDPVRFLPFHGFGLA